jgi:hypothetical protein
MGNEATQKLSPSALGEFGEFGESRSMPLALQWTSAGL